MKSLLLVAFLATPATFCMKTEKEIYNNDAMIAATLKGELGELMTRRKLLDRRVTYESISGALQKAFGHEGPDHVGYASIDVINQCYAQEITPAAQTYIAGFLDALAAKKSGSKEHERIMLHALRGRVQHLNIQQPKL
jgi:hypothetical protein